MPKTDDLWALSAVLETDMGERPVVVTTGTRNDVEACLDRHPELNDHPYLSYGIVRVAEGPTCEYLPEEGVSWWDEDDNEHEEPRLGEEYCSCFCSECGYPMLGGETGWFDYERGEHGYRPVPRFEYCPNCGRRVMG